MLLVLINACRSPMIGPEQEDVQPKVQFTGNHTIGSGRLEDIVLGELEGLLREIGARAAVDDAAFAVSEHYRELGFPDVEVTYEWIPGDSKNPKGLAKFQVKEGRRAAIAELLFSGNTAISSKALTALYDAPRLGLLGSGLRAFEQSAADSFAGDIADLYFDRGYLEARVPPPEAKWNKDMTLVSLIYQVNEGPFFMLHSVTFDGVEEAEQAQLDQLAARFLGKSFVPRVASEVRGALVSHFGEAGYPQPKIETTRGEGEQPGQVTLAYKIQVGERVRLREIKVEGNDRTRESTVLRLLALKKGDWFRLSAERESFDALYGSGLFESVGLRLIDQKDGEATWLVELKESPAGELYVEPGYGSYEGFRVRAGVRDSNLLGLGHTGRAEITAGLIAQQAELGYTNPALYGSKLELDVSTYWTNREEPTFLRRELGAGTTVTRRFDSKRRLALGYRYRHSQATNVEVVDPATLAALETVNVSSVTLTPTYDSRVGVFAPSSGTLARFILEYAGTVLGSEIDFIRMRVTLSNYMPLREGTILATSARTGVIQPVDGTNDIPIQERFFNGGENTVRSFRQDDLGLLDVNGKSIGGEGFTVLSAELRQQLFGTVQVAAFADTGNLVGDASDYLQFDKFRHALGVGIRYLLPIGPLRLDWGWNPNPSGAEENWVLHLSVGMAF